MTPTTPLAPNRDPLAADCARCVALCCVVPGFSSSADFAVDKPAGTRCQHLGDDHRCTIHGSLLDRGFGGCVAYDCFGAGQRLSGALGAAATARRGSPDVARAFAALRALHELRWLLRTAAVLAAAAQDLPAVRAAQRRVDELAGSTLDELAELDVDEVRGEVNPVLLACSARARAGAPGPRADLRGADLAGADLRTTDLRGASLRGAVLVGADLRGADLTGADLTGADLRGADVTGARLDGALFLTDMQRRSTRDAAPGSLRR
jgi:hypothetical protein